jgi:hypothetical protein
VVVGSEQTQISLRHLLSCSSFQWHN